jgi:drug/metabolite transporter (DMT)-like permease
MEPEPGSPLPSSPQKSPLAQDAIPLGYLYAAAGTALFSTKAILIKLAYAETISVETLLALRMGLALPFYLMIGALGYWFPSHMDFLGLQYITAHFERLILFTYPLFVVVLGAIVFGQRIRPQALLAFAISYFGLALIFTENFSLEGEEVILGSAFVLAAALAFALYQLLAKEAIAKVGPRLFNLHCDARRERRCVYSILGRRRRGGYTRQPNAFLCRILIALFATVLPPFFSARPFTASPLKQTALSARSAHWSQLFLLQQFWASG